MNSKNQFAFKKLIVPGMVMLAFWIGSGGQGVVEGKNASGEFIMA